jgi:bacterioferritin
MERGNIVQELIKAYSAELETVENYVAASVNLDGVRSEVIKESLLADIPAELMHAQKLAARIKIAGGTVPGSLSLHRDQAFLQPPGDSMDVASVIRGVIAAEESAIKQYNTLIKMCEGVDYATQDLCIQILGDEEEHRREFVGVLKEYDRK